MLASADTSKVVVRQPTPHIDSLAKGSRRYTPGMGANKDGQGVATCTGYYDRTTIDKLNSVASSKPTVFNRPNSTEAQDVVTGEFCVTYKIQRSAQTENPHALKFFSALNSIGPDIKEAFPKDIEMQRMAVRNRIKFAGIAADMAEYSKNNKRQGTALRIFGESTVYTENDLAPGLLAELIVPDPTKRSSANNLKRPFVPPEKVLLELAPYNPRTLEMRVVAIMRSYGANEDSFKKGMDPKIRTTSLWINFAESAWFSSLVSWAIITKSLMTSGVIKPIIAKTTGPFSISSREDGLTGIPAILGIMKAFGALPETGESNSGISNDFKLSKGTREAFHGLKRDVFRKVFYDGQIVQDAFDYNPDTREASGREARGGKIKMQDPMGSMLWGQINHAKMQIGAINDAIRTDSDWLVGKVSKGSQAGGRADIFR